MNPRALHVESAVGALLPAVKKARYGAVLDELTPRLLPDESIVACAEIWQEDPTRRIGAAWGLVVLTTVRLFIGPEKPDGAHMAFEMAIGAVDLQLVKSKWLGLDVVIQSPQGPASYTLSKPEGEGFLQQMAAVRANPAGHIRPDVAAFDAAAGPWWTQLADDYRLTLDCRFVVEPSRPVAREADVVFDRTGITVTALKETLWQAAWPEVRDVATGQMKPGANRKARGFLQGAAGGVQADEAGLAGIFLVATADEIATFNIKQLSPTPLTRLMTTLNYFVDDHLRRSEAAPDATAPPAAAPPAVAPAETPTPPPPPPAPPAAPPRDERRQRIQRQMVEALHADGILTAAELAEKLRLIEQSG